MKFLLPFVALLACGVAAAAPQAAPSSASPSAQAPGYYRVRLGRMTATVLSDGTAAVPFDQLLRGLPRPAIDRAFAAAGETADRATSINAFLVDTGEHRILIDAGAGALFGPCCGRLPQALAAAGYRPEQIDAVLLTHVHGDHSGGLVRDGARVFPNADLYLSKTELDFWTSDAEQARATPSHRQMFVEGRAALAPYLAAHRVHTFAGRSEVFPGITAVPAAGHTPGHTFYELESDGHRLLVVGDLVHAAEIQFGRPAVTIDFDIDQAAAAARRRAALAALADSHELVAGDHLSFPGLGHVQRLGDAFVWAPLPYQADVAQVGR